MKANGERFIPQAGMGHILELEHMHRYCAVAPLLTGKVVLDAACGVGYGSQIIAKYAERVIGIDIDEEAVSYAEKNHKQDNILFKQMSIADMEFEPGSFDVVVSFETIEHVSEEIQHAFLAQVSRLLKPNGLFIVSTPDLDVQIKKSQGNYYNPFHIKEYNYDDFEKLLKKHFSYVTMHAQERMICSIIDGKNAQIINQSEGGQRGDYIIAVCSAAPIDLPLESVYISEENDSEIIGAFYFDQGDGYSELNKTLSYRTYQESGEFSVTIDLKNIEGLKKVRFDPCKFPAKVKIAAQNEGDNPIEVKPLNGTFVLDGMIHFMHSDPSFEMDFVNKDVPDRIVLKGKCLRYSQAEVDFYWQQRVVDLSEEKNALCVEYNGYKMQTEVALAEKGEEQKKLLAEREQQFKEALTEKDKQFGEALAEKDKQFEEALAEKDKQFGEVLAEKDKQFEEALAEKDKQFGEVLAEKDKQLEEALIKKEKQLQGELETELRAARQYINQLEAQYEIISNSQFWKITGPMRKTLDAVKRTHSGALLFKGCKYLKQFGVKATVRKTVDYYNKKSDDLFIQKLPEVEKVHSFTELIEVFEENGYLILLPEVLKSYEKGAGKKILLITHELSLTGAPVALGEYAKCLKELGYLSAVISPSDGALKNELQDQGIPVIIYPKLFISKDSVFKFIELFDMVVASTIICGPVIETLSGMDIPCLWWIHEAEASYSQENVNAMPKYVSNNIYVYAGGEYAKCMLKKYRPQYTSQILLYGVPDAAKAIEQEEKYELPVEAAGKKVFCLAGTIEQRKGQDILVDAIRQLSPEEIAKAYFIFVGKQHYQYGYNKIMEIIQEYPENVTYIEQLPRKELQKLYVAMDCLICASTDDPMPIVVAEALAFSKSVICSQNTGFAALLERDGSGLVYRNNDPMELAVCIRKVLSNDQEVQHSISRARMTYETDFSDQVFKENIKKIMSRIEDVKGYNPLSMRYLLDEFQRTCKTGDYIFDKEVVKNYDNDSAKKILLISHEFSLTGAPIVLQSFAKELQRQGADVLVLSMVDGPLSEELKKDGIPVAVYSMLYQNDFLERFADSFDLIVLNTVVTFRAVRQLRFSKTPVIWWIHDSRASYEVGGFATLLPEKLPENVRILCGGEYAKKQLLNYYPQYADRTEVLLYGVSDYKKTGIEVEKYPLGKQKDKYLFAVIGLQDMRKGHDVFAQAIKELSDEERKNAQFIFIGRHLDMPIAHAVDEVCEMYPEQVRYITEVNRQELFSVYEQCDCIVCSSKDDPLPVFMTEAMMMSKTIICSENTGTAAIIKQENCGYLYYNNSPAELAQKMREAMQNKDHSAKMQARARAAYEKHFSEEAFADSISHILASLEGAEQEEPIYQGRVSVVIPTYNAGEDFEKLLVALRNQKRVRSLEIVVVDSGSKDGTVLLCREYGAKVLEISQSEFSHSYARNLGAKHSSGELILFMTQDAIPSYDGWVYGMIEPIIKGEAVATSCREECPETTDLYYRISSWRHSRYLGIAKNDQLNTFSETETHESLRKKASLNDVSSAFDAKIFRKFNYRYDYAEDLDMGLRLLRSGYTIKLLSTVTVIHGHNRIADYYLKRGFVESLALRVILGTDQNIAKNPCVVARQVVCGAIKLNRVVVNQMNQMQEQVSREQFFDSLMKELSQSRCNPVDIEMESAQCFGAENTLMHWCISILRDLATECCNEENDLFDHTCFCVETIFRVYFSENNIAVLNREMQMAICSCMEKQFFLIAGNVLSTIDEECELYVLLQELKKGV